MADVYVQVDETLQKDETDAALRTIVYPVTTGEVSTTELVSKAGGTYATSTAVQAVLDTLQAKLEIPTADLDTLGVLAYKLTGAIDVVFISGIKVVDYDPFSEGALSDEDIRFRASQR